MSIVGLDLAGVESRPTGLCVLRDMKAETSLVYTDEEVLEKTEESKPKIVARALSLVWFFDFPGFGHLCSQDKCLCEWL